MSIRHSKGAINYIDTDHQTLQTLVNCFIANKPECNINFGSDCVYLPYLNTTQISVKTQVFEGFFGKLLFRIVNYLLRLKISRVWMEHDEKLTCPTSDLTRKYEQAHRFF